MWDKDVEKWVEKRKRDICGTLRHWDKSMGEGQQRGNVGRGGNNGSRNGEQARGFDQWIARHFQTTEDVS